MTTERTSAKIAAVVKEVTARLEKRFSTVYGNGELPAIEFVCVRCETGAVTGAPKIAGEADADQPAPVVIVADVCPDCVKSGEAMPGWNRFQELSAVLPKREVH